MKVTFSRLVIGVESSLPFLGLLRYRPWSNREWLAPEKSFMKDPIQKQPVTLTVGFLPVTCHLTCPVTDYASKTTQTNTNFNSRRILDLPDSSECVGSKAGTGNIYDRTTCNEAPRARCAGQDMLPGSSRWL
jgi:NitT/TauT family transport system substrate-binding protein